MWHRLRLASSCQYDKPMEITASLEPTCRHGTDKVPLGCEVARHADALEVLLLPLVERADEADEHVERDAVRLGGGPPELARHLAGDAGERVC